MSKESNHQSDMGNSNKGTSGQNETHAKNQGNRGEQMNPNKQTSNPKKGK